MSEFLPFARPEIDEETIAAVADVLRSGWITSGPQVQRFEAELSSYFGGRPARTFTHATAALEIAVRLAGVGPGDEVIVPAMTFAASANVVQLAGGRPVFVDVDLDSRNTDAARIEAAITPRTRAIMPVHFAGLPVDMEPLYALAKRRGLRVIEDAAHAMGASYRGRRIGAQGDLVAFSFHPNKNLTTIEGGALSFADAGEVERAERLRFHASFPAARWTCSSPRASRTCLTFLQASASRSSRSWSSSMRSVRRWHAVTFRNWTG